MAVLARDWVGSKKMDGFVGLDPGEEEEEEEDEFVVFVGVTVTSLSVTSTVTAKRVGVKVTSHCVLLRT